MMFDDELTWEKIYSYWCYFECFYPELKDPMNYIIKPVPKKCEQKVSQLYHSTWIEKNTRNEPKKTEAALFEQMMRDNAFLWNAGTIHTAYLLTLCQTEEERAAIWISAFARTIICKNEYLNPKDRKAIYFKLEDILYKSCALFAPLQGGWHVKSQTFFPQFFFPHYILSEKNDFSYVSLIEMAATNAALILNHYTPITYELTLNRKKEQTNNT